MGKEQLADPARHWLVEQVVHICAKTGRNKGGGKQTVQPQGSSIGKLSLKSLNENVGVEEAEANK